MKTVLLTGFEPFNQESVNPAWEAVRLLDGWGEGSEEEGGFVVHARRLPCVFGLANEALREALAELAPVLVICVGQAGGRSDISLERVAINVDDAPIADNAQCQLIDTPVVAGGPVGYFSTLPIKAIVRELRAAGLPASVSQTAGTFVCNHVFYGLMDALAATPVRAGFIHIPYLPAQAAAHPGAPSMALADMARGLRIAVSVALAGAEDVREAGGRTH
ncbi:MAG: pyroglutamyl-peptidase I [Pseudomonadota bacterium]